MKTEILLKRINKELSDLEKQPRPGITCYPIEDDITQLEAFIEGPPDTPYEQGLFKLSVQIPERYPFRPPQIKFITRIYHPNIDDGGRICADILKEGEKGSWNPAINVGTALMSLRQLISVPNPDDPLEVDIAREFKLDYPTFERKAKEFTKKYATGDETENNEISTTSTEELKEKVLESEDLLLTQVEEERPKKFLSLSKKKLSSSNSQSSASQSLKEDRRGANDIQSKSGTSTLSSFPIKEIDDAAISESREKNKVKEPSDEVALVDEENTILHNIEKKAEIKNVVLKKKSRKNNLEKQPITNAIESTHNKVKKAAKRKTKELDDEDAIDEKADLKKYNRTDDPSNKAKAISSVEDCNSSADLDSKSLNMEINAFNFSRVVDRDEDQFEHENIASLKVNDGDIASNAIDIITSSMDAIKEKSNNYLTGTQDIIELSDDDADENMHRPIYHSFTHPKRSSKPKISLSRKKRS